MKFGIEMKVLDSLFLFSVSSVWVGKKVMRALLIFLILVQWGSARRVQNARAYSVSREGIYEAFVEGVLEKEKRVDFSRLPRLKEASFKSRFVNEGDDLLDLTQWGIAMFLVEDRGDQVVWNKSTGKLVVWTDEKGHREVIRHFRHFLKMKVGVKVRLLRVADVTLGNQGIRAADLPGEPEELGAISGILKGWELEEVESEDGGLSFGMNVGWDQDLAVWESAVTLKSKSKGAKFEWKGALIGIWGEPLVLELGSVRGGKSLLVEITLTGVLKDGSALRKWVMSEDGSAEWWEDAMGELIGPWQEPNFDGRGRVRRRFTVPPTFLTFISTGRKDPFLAEDEGVVKEEPMELLKSNGVEFREGDSVVFYKDSSVLEVVASPLAMNLIEGIISTGPPYPIAMIRQCFVLVESDEKLTAGTLAAGKFQIRQKVSQCLLPGQSAEMRLGRTRIEAEAQIDWEGSLVESRFTLKWQKGGEVKSGGQFEAWMPVIVQQSMVGKKWQAWVLTASVLRARDYINFKK